MMKPILQCPKAADRGQSSHNQFKSSDGQLPARYLSVNAERKKHNSKVNGYSSEVLSSGIITSLQTHANLTADGKHETQFSRYLQDIIYMSALPVRCWPSTSLAHKTTSLCYCAIASLFFPRLAVSGYNPKRKVRESSHMAGSLF